MFMVAPRWRILLLLFVPLAASAGCDWIPVRRRLDPHLYPFKGRPAADRADSTSAIGPPRPPSALGALVSSRTPPEDLPELPALRPISDEEAFETPMLDAALRRASTLREAALNGFDAPNVPEESPSLTFAIPPEVSEAKEFEGDGEKSALSTAERSSIDEGIETPPLQPNLESPPLLESPEALELEPVPESTPSEREQAGLTDPSGFESIETLPVGRSAEALKTDAQLLPSVAEEVLEESASLWQTVLTILEEAESDWQLNPEDEVEVPPDISKTPSAPASIDSNSPLKITNLRLCRSVQNFGKYEEMAVADCRPGRDVILYCELEGVGYEPLEDRFRSRIATTLELLPEDRGPALWSDSRLAEDTCSRPRRDYFVNYLITLPATLQGGSYRLQITQHDLVTEATNSRTLPMAIFP